MYTKNAAEIVHRGDRSGRIKEGYMADFAVFDRDVMTEEADELLEAEVLYTVIDGEVVYQKGGIEVTLKMGIFGAGHGGVTAAAGWTEVGHGVTLYQSAESEKNLEKISESNEIILNGEAVKIHSFTREVEEAVSGQNVLMLAIPAPAVEKVTENLAQHLEDGQYIYINSASAMCSIRLRNVL